MTRGQGKMPVALAKKILDEVGQIAPDTKLWLTFYGEPTLIADRVAYLAQYAAKRGCRDIRLNTNASRLSPDAAEVLLDCGITDIILSLDAVTPAVYDLVRHPAFFDKVTQNSLFLIRRAKEIGSNVRIHAQFVNGPKNAHELSAFSQRWLDEGVAVKIKDYIHWTVPVDDPQPQWRIACPWAFTTFVALWDGRVACCGADFDARHCHGNLYQNNITELWNGPMRVFRELHLRHQFKALPDICSSCGDWNVTISEVRCAPPS
jgi:hypothetical protein